MIDFRYHVVSLISVFLALAVGIALGAGPLKETIGDTLTGQVQQLRGEKDALRSELDDTSADLADTRSYVDAAGPALLDGSLTGRRVVVVALGSVTDSDSTAIDDRLTQAGAEITGHATLTDAWADPDQRSFRQALAGNLVQFLEPAPDKAGGLEAELGAALVQGLVGADPAAPDALTQDASYLLEILSTGDNPLVAFDDPITKPADAVVVVAATPAKVAAEPSPSAAPTDEDLEPQLAVVQAAQQYSAGAVLADGPRGAGTLTDAILGDDDLASTLTTVSDSSDITAQVNVPLALAARIGGKNGHYGFGEGETVIPPSVELPPVDRTPVAPDAGSGSDDSAGSGG
ncbi:copper transporter [Cellulomonas edaphi]|uniref:Copper transporter n=1 Tax=Cellulomonas edaphi TaxID=3053468 RepID=A0ABT7S7L7_9CELL|nr:copper transporter [Cellulomons edaphi]MDM7830929.1 copper transporter [Cellulomons edaphi]